jgi:hypothetical protein
MIKRKLDRKKLLKEARTLLFGWLGFSLIFFLYRHFDVKEHNALRAAIDDAPIQTSAIIKEVNDRKGARYAVFEFVGGQKRVEGRTFTSYKGLVGDSVCVTYSKWQPTQNIYCNDLERENYYDAVVMDTLNFSALIAAAIAIVIPILVLWGFATGNRRLISELTSRKR